MNINTDNTEDFLKQLQVILKSEVATKTKSIIYIWRTQLPISRVSGHSPIIYIGKTINTLRSRYNNSKSLKIETLYFEKYYKFMIEKYGAISIEIIKSNNPNLQEWEALMSYNKVHKEYPPLNRSIPNAPK